MADEVKTIKIPTGYAAIVQQVAGQKIGVENLKGLGNGGEI